MLNFDPTTHPDLFSFREYLEPWWETRPAEVVGLAIYGSRAKNYAHKYSDWDIVILTASNNPNEDYLCRDLPVNFEDAPIHALCESIDNVKAEATIGGCLLSAIAEQGVSLFGTTVPFEEDTIKESSYSNADTFFSQVLDEICSFLVAANIRFRKKKKQQKDATTKTVRAAEYMVKSFMSVRGINFFYVHDVKALCDQFEEKFPKDPVVNELRKLNSFTAKGHKGPYRQLHLPTEPLNRSNRRIYQVLSLLPRLAEEIFGHRDTPEITKEFITEHLESLDKFFKELEDPELKRRLGEMMNGIWVYFE